MDVVIERAGGVAIVKPSGRVDAGATQELQQKLNDLLAEGERSLVLDLGSTEHLGGAGIRLLLNIAKKLGSRGGGLILCSMSDDHKRAFNVAGVAQQFAIAGSRADAVRLLEAAESVARLSDEAARLLADAEDRNASSEDAGS